MMNPGLFSSKEITWETPQDFFDYFDSLYHFDLDTCASKDNAKVARFFSIKDDGLAQAWGGGGSQKPTIAWMNPPYGKTIKLWIQKAYQEAKCGSATVVSLIPARTDTAYWHDFVMKSTQIIFVRGRLRFSGSTNSAPFPSAVVIFEASNVGLVPSIDAIGKNPPLVKQT
ncbi:MAG: adenine methyltransferase [Armatimonadetes bacterium]|nr:adenine methyltransferase [Armatimonadota bacterium]